MRAWQRIVAVVLIIALACPADAFARRKRARSPTTPAAISASIWDSDANRYYFAKNIDGRVYPASTTKVMTALLVLERLSLDQYVTVSSRATQVPETKLNLRPGEQYKVRDLLYAALLKSANDAAIVLAEAVAGSQAQFVSLMNDRAARIGVRHTRFANAHGLPSDGRQYTTARDMALIFQEALKQPFFRQAVTYKYRVIYSKAGRRLFLKSHNKSLFLNWKRSVYGKTGYTRQAQSCFVGYFTKDSHSYIVAVFGSQKRWDYMKWIIERYGKVDL